MRRWPPYYSQSDYHRKMLDLFKSQAVIRTLFALGKSAEYRYYETAEEGGQEAGDYVNVDLRRDLRGRAEAETDFLHHLGHEPQDRRAPPAAATGRSAASMAA